MIRFSGLFCAILSAVLLSLSFPPFGFGFLAYIAFIPMFFVIKHFTVRRIFFWSWFSGVIFHFITINWIRHITWAGMICAVLVLSIFYAIPFVVAGILKKHSLYAGLALLPFAVTAIEWSRSFGQLAFPWMAIGNSQTSYPFLIQFADITSVYGVSFWVILINAAVYLLFVRKSFARGVFVVVLFILPLMYSWFVIHHSHVQGNEIRVALIQGNVTPEEKWGYGLEKWNINLYRSMSIESLDGDPDLIIWPETAVPAYAAEVSSYRRMIQSFVDSANVPVVTGLPVRDYDTYETWNSAGLFVPGKENVDIYHKIHLVPFGEAIPFDELFPSLRELEWGQANWDEGGETVVFQPPDLPPFNVAVCFESIFPDLLRKFIREGSQFIVVITNDVWFGPYASPIQHAMISVMRAIEFHIPVVRCANTGISMIIDPYGRIVKRTNTFERTVLSGTISPGKSKTIYSRFGPFFSLLCLIMTLGSLLISFFESHHGLIGSALSSGTKTQIVNEEQISQS